MKNILATLVALTIFALGGFVVLLLVFSSAISGMNSDTSVPNNSVLRVVISGDLEERIDRDDKRYIFEDEVPVGLREILQAIDYAKTCSSVKAIFLEFKDGGIDYADADEIRQALISFKGESGKPVFSYSNFYSQSQYLIASVSDSILLNPIGSVDIKGISFSALYKRSLLDTLGVKFNVVKVGSYKSGPEEYTADSMSDENRMQLRVFAENIWSSFVSDIKQSRPRLENIDFLDLVNSRALAFEPARSVVELGFADKLVYEDDISSMMKFEFGNDVKFTSVSALVNNMNVSLQSDDVVAVVYVEGTIGGEEEDVDYEEVVKSLSKIETDSRIKSVVLRVNSPGGSAFASEQIWKAVKDVRDAGKPVVVSMGGYAASGGYYVSAAANKVVASPYTLTGSIGVYALLPNVSDLCRKVGLNYQTVEIGEFADVGSIYKPLSDADNAVLYKSVWQSYSLFTARCKEHRRVLEEDCGGRIWSGVEAEKRSLVDELGTFSDAIGLAARESELEAYSLEYYPVREFSIFSQVKSVSKLASTSLFGRKGVVEELTSYLNKFDRLQAQLPFTVVMQ